MAKLAVNGGTPLRNVMTDPWPAWPVWGDEERDLLHAVLESGVWSYNGPKERAFSKAWAEYCGTTYALAIANGTVTLQLALEALNIGWGDEVIVPGCTWQATAAAVLDINAVPVFVDIDPDSWCLDPQAVAAAVTPRTRAIIPVHLYGAMADMDAILAIARKHHLRVIEDCAHQHGSEWQGRKAGSLGDIGSFSMQLSKVLTAGEGGALTTNDRDLWIRLDALRNCGRRPEELTENGDKGAGVYVSEGDLIQSGNYRLTEFQAAVLLGQLKRLPEQTEQRDANGRHLNTLLAQIPGITPQKRDPRTTRQAYFNYGFRYDKTCFNGLPIEKFRWALMGELGCVADACYQPLNDCALYRPQTKKRYHISAAHWQAVDPRRFALPAGERLYRDESVCFHHKVLMGPRSDMELIAAAIQKIAAAPDEYDRIVAP